MKQKDVLSQKILGFEGDPSKFTFLVGHEMIFYFGVRKGFRSQFKGNSVANGPNYQM